MPLKYLDGSVIIGRFFAMLEFLWRICWKNLGLLQRIAAYGVPLGLSAISGVVATESNWLLTSLVGLCAILFVVAWKCAEQAKAHEDDLRPQFEIAARVRDNQVQIVVRNTSTKSIADVEVKVANQRAPNSAEIHDLHALLKSQDGRKSPITFNPNDPLYFSFAWIEGLEVPKSEGEKAGGEIYIGCPEPAPLVLVGPRRTPVRLHDYDGGVRAVSNPVVAKVRVSGRDFRASSAQFLVGFDSQGKMTVQALDFSKIKQETERLAALQPKTSVTG